MNILISIWDGLGSEGRLYLGLGIAALLLVVLERLLQRFPRVANGLAAVRAMLPDPLTSLLHAQAALGRKRLLEPAAPTTQRPQMPPEASDASAPKTPRSGTLPGGPSLLLLLGGAALVVLHQLACTPQQLAALAKGVQLLGQVCDVVADVADRDEVEYACTAVDAAAPLVSMIPTASASAPPGAKAGPPVPSSSVKLAANPYPPAPPKPKAHRVVVPRAQVPAFERENRVRR